MIAVETFTGRDALADVAAEAVAQCLSAPEARLLVAAGGSTPGPVYDRLARMDLAWERLNVTLTDERWVDPTSNESNEALIRARLLTGEAARAGFLPLKRSGVIPADDAAAADAALREVLPAAVVLLGMGEDGHIASLFPGAPELAVGLDLAAAPLAIAVAEAGLEPFVARISLTLRALTDTALVIVLISGEGKRQVVQRIAADPAYAPPVAAVLRQSRTPVRILWAA
ncbi:MAG TPA: 6-phosphogluconolactonase [Caulobacteraceae bacterium]|jgi:6-phosphogluconolactonase|nr:6-phosphogluconolactonase [Caulobacteraceae bacterium]